MITVDGTPISLATDGAIAVLGSSTEIITAAQSLDVGGYIWSGLGGGILTNSVPASQGNSTNISVTPADPNNPTATASAAALKHSLHGVTIAMGVFVLLAEL